MVNEPRPVERLVAFARDERSGEFICAAPSVEIHVYLQDGRVAWATDSQHPLAFSKHLQENTAIDAATLREVLLSCRKEKLPLGETLVDWKLASWDQVRAALRHQIAQAVTVLETVETGQAVFLERAYARYDDKLTFSVLDFVAERREEPGGRIEGPVGARAALALTGDGPALSRQVRTAVDGLAWTEIFDGETRVGEDPIGAVAQRTPPDLVRATVLDGADFAAFRSARGCVVGLEARGAPGRSLWCGLEADSTFGAIVSALVAAVDAGPTETAAPSPEPADWTVRSDDPSMAEELRGFMTRAEDLLGVILTGRDPARPPRVAISRSKDGCASFIELAARRGRTLALWDVFGTRDAASSRDDPVAFCLRTMVTGEPEVWCFGGEVHPESPETAWVFVDRRKAQGLGWAYLSALVRLVAKSVEMEDA